MAAISEKRLKISAKLAKTRRRRNIWRNQLASWLIGGNISGRLGA